MIKKKPWSISLRSGSLSRSERRNMRDAGGGVDEDKLGKSEKDQVGRLFIYTALLPRWRFAKKTKSGIKQESLKRKLWNKSWLEALESRRTSARPRASDRARSSGSSRHMNLSTAVGSGTLSR